MAIAPRSTVPTTGETGPVPLAAAGHFAMFGALRFVSFRLFWAGQLASVTGQTMEFVALAWLVLELTNSPFLLGLTGLTQALPSIGLALIAGAIADRMDRKRMMVTVMATVAVLYLGLGTLVVTQAVQVWHVLLIALLLGCVRVFEQPARHGLLPYLVPREQMANAVALQSFSWQVPRPVGPALAGLLIAAFSVGPTLYATGLCAAAAMLLFSRVHVERVAYRNTDRSLLHNMAEGLSFIRRHETFYGLMGMAFFNSIFGVSYLIVLPVFAREVLHVGSEGYGFLQGAGGIGAVVGTLVVAFLASSAGKGRQVIAGGVLFGCLLVALSFSQWYFVALGLLFVLGVANQTYMTSITTVLQLNVPDELRGRVMSVWGLTFSLVPLGGAVAGTVAQYAGAPFAMRLGGLLVIGIAVAVALCLPGIRRLR